MKIKIHSWRSEQFRNPWSKHSRKVLRETRLGRQTVQWLMECGFHDKPGGVSIEELKQCWDIDFYFIGSAWLHCRGQSSPSAKSNQGTIRREEMYWGKGMENHLYLQDLVKKNFGGWWVKGIIEDDFKIQNLEKCEEKENCKGKEWIQY